METPQSNISSGLAEPEEKNDELILEKSMETGTNYVGVLDVHVHQARDILNICIYHKQDVYAKVSLTSDPENAVSTQIINGGGQNPVFDQTLRLNVRSLECSLKSEIWMMSRVKNYLQDQSLGFALVPLSEVLLENGKLEKEFILSSTDLFHSPAGFVQLSISYTGSSPEIISIPKAVEDIETVESLACEFEKIEFPDPKIVNENNLMVSEYIGIGCTNVDSNSSDSIASSNTENRVNPIQIPKRDSPPSSVSTNGSVLGSKSSKSELAKPLVSVNIEPEQGVVQQDIVDMYMKSMQQFTESLAKMKLPLGNDTKPSSSGNSGSDQRSETPKSAGSRVFYGSRAFF